MFGVSIGPPNEAIAENPRSSSTAYTTFGAPSGAFGGSNGDQSGTESRMSTLILPLNGAVMRAPWDRHDDGSESHAIGCSERSSTPPVRTSPRPDDCWGPHPALASRCQQVSAVGQ